jgi:uncharacterized protein
MADLFFDSSALVKRYVQEVGTPWVNNLIAAPTSTAIHIANPTCVEVVAAIARRRHGGLIAAPDAALLIQQFRQEYSTDYAVVAITPAIIYRAADLADTHALRGSDALQLAVALEVHQQCQSTGVSLTVISADTELNAAALAEGLTVDDPNNHP